MDQDVLVRDEIEAGAELVRRFNERTPLSAAFWAKASDEGTWFLFLASDQFEASVRGEAYGEVTRLAREMNHPSFDPFHIKLIGTSNPLAKATLDIYRRYASILPTRLGPHYLGNEMMEGVYIYPEPATQPTA